MWNGECLQEMPNLEASISADCFRGVDVYIDLCLDDVVPYTQCTYTIVTFSLTTPTSDLRTRRQ